MADTKLSALTALTGANLDVADLFYVDDVSVTTSKKITMAELRIGLGVGSALTNSLSGDVNLSNTGSYFDGPSVAQGTTGTWFTSGGVVVTDAGGAAVFHVKLWDGTTVIDSRYVATTGAALRANVSLSGFLAAPAGNLRISVKDITNTTGKISFNDTGNSKDSTITAFRVA